MVATRATWPTNAAASARTRRYQEINLRRALANPNENWMAERLATTGLRWTRQARWGFCIFDFWCSAKGIAVEVDGATHDAGWDAFRDKQNHKRSGVLVLRVRNRNEADSALALATIAEAGLWKPSGSSRSTRVRKRRPDGAVRCRCGQARMG